MLDELDMYKKTCTVTYVTLILFVILLKLYTGTRVNYSLFNARYISHCAPHHSPHTHIYVYNQYPSHAHSFF